MDPGHAHFAWQRFESRFSGEELGSGGGECSRAKAGFFDKSTTSSEKHEMTIGATRLLRQPGARAFRAVSPGLFFVTHAVVDAESDPVFAGSFDKPAQFGPITLINGGTFVVHLDQYDGRFLGCD